MDSHDLKIGLYNFDMNCSEPRRTTMISRLNSTILGSTVENPDPSNILIGICFIKALKVTIDYD